MIEPRLGLYAWRAAAKSPQHAARLLQPALAEIVLRHGAEMGKEGKAEGRWGSTATTPANRAMGDRGL